VASLNPVSSFLAAWPGRPAADTHLPNPHLGICTCDQLCCLMTWKDSLRVSVLFATLSVTITEKSYCPSFRSLSGITRPKVICWLLRLLRLFLPSSLKRATSLLFWLITYSTSTLGRSVA